MCLSVWPGFHQSCIICWGSCVIARGGGEGCRPAKVYGPSSALWTRGSSWKEVVGCISLQRPRVETGGSSGLLLALLSRNKRGTGRCAICWSSEAPWFLGEEEKGGREAGSLRGGHRLERKARPTSANLLQSIGWLHPGRKHEENIIRYLPSYEAAVTMSLSHCCDWTLVLHRKEKSEAPSREHAPCKLSVSTE